VRADHLGAYGYAQARTPTLDALAQRGVLFERAFCQAPMTLPSHTSILSGTYPAAHGVRDNFFVVPHRVTTLADLLSIHAGYKTAAFVSGYPLVASFGLNQGFALYDDALPSGVVDNVSGMNVSERSAGATTDRALAWLGSASRGPFFLWVHYFDPHTDYEPPAPYSEQFADRPYDGEIAYVDAELGRLLAALRRLELDRNTIIAVIGDHGEALGEHGELEHGMTLYDAATQIPLILVAPDRRWAGRRIETVVESVDLMPTLLELLDQPIPSKVQGRSLLPLIEGQLDRLRAASYSETFMPRLAWGYCELLSLRSDDWRLVLAPRPELYDLGSDPGALENLHDRRPEEANRLRSELARRLERMDPTGSAEAPTILDPEARAKLESLGYFGGAGSGSSSDSTRSDQACLGDPKDIVGLPAEIRQAQELFAGSRFQEALAKIDAILPRVPPHTKQWDNLRSARHMIAQHLGRTATVSGSEPP